MKVMTMRFAAAIVGSAFSSVAGADDGKLHFVGDFESGHIARNGSNRDGFYVATLPENQSGNEFLHSGQSDFGPTSGADTRVVRSEEIGGETVMPRSGEYFLRSEVYRTKNYLELNGYAKNRPRSKIYMSDESHRIEFDNEGFVGFSIYVPKNFENELGVKDHRGESMLFVMNTNSTRTLLSLGVWVQGSDTEAHWFVRANTSSNSTQEDGAKMEVFDLGPVRPDIGKWTDFVFRYRFNPFAVATNPAAKGIPDSRNQMFEGNKGILQVWKAEGATNQEGNRTMALRVDKVNQPVGLVPHSTDGIKHLWRIYKYGWLSNPTTLTHPVWFGFDEIRQGLVERDGTSFADVAPSGQGCTSNCGAVADSKPRPPASLVVD